MDLGNIFLKHRRVIIILADILIVVASYVIAFNLRFKFNIPPAYIDVMLKTLVVLIPVRLVFFYMFGLFHGWLRYIDIYEIINIFKASSLGTLTFAFIVYIMFGYIVYPRIIFILDGMLVLLMITGLRLLLRGYKEKILFFEKNQGKRILIVGAGYAGEMILREMLANPQVKYNPVGFVDKVSTKVGWKIHGKPILGTINDIGRIIDEKSVEELILALPSVTGKEMNEMKKSCLEHGVQLRKIPSMSSLLEGNVTINQIRNVQLDDLLERAPADLDIDEMERKLIDKTILVTGAAGSIGSELAKQLAGFNPGRLLLLERDENSLFYFMHELKSKEDINFITPVIGDILDKEQLENIFTQYRPDIVFHAAAYKHVPIMEDNISQAVKNNIFGTWNVALCADKFKVKEFIFVSTDKAVHPSSVMGTTKRVAEIMISEGFSDSSTKFLSVRFGNVLGSRGSVIPFFRKQIELGGPVTVTHPDMVRYFMTIPEAVMLILQTTILGNKNEIFVLNMGEPIKIVKLAENLIRLSGLKLGEDIDIVYSGLRPGEKLYEELVTDEEEYVHTEHENILIFKGSASGNRTGVEDDIRELEELVSNNDEAGLIKKLKALVPEYNPQNPRIQDIINNF